MRRPHQPAKSRIPEFKSIEEEAEFWDTHDTTDFEDEFKPTNVRIAENLSHRIVIDIDSQASRMLDKIAREKGVNPILLARSWILEHLQSQDGAEVH